MRSLSPCFEVPANSSRFFDVHSEAVSERLGKIHLVWDDACEIVCNEEFSSDLVKYDSKYCTSVSSIGSTYKIPTLSYFDQVLSFTRQQPLVIDVGCGQGEFVSALRSKGINAVGFDPVLRTSGQYLKPKLWEPSDLIGDLYVLRCVLPHIQNPWEFIAQISNSAPKALVLIEFQRLEWILQHKIWYQVSHDHVNLFSIEDFLNKYNVIHSGTFANGEWGWVLIDPSDCKVNQRAFPVNYTKSFTELFIEKQEFINHLASNDRPIAIWGAAGKGTVLAHALLGVRGEFLAIDADSHRWGHFLESSGSQVLSPDEAMNNLRNETLVLVCNPNHFQEIHSYVQNRFELRLPSDLKLNEF